MRRWITVLSFCSTLFCCPSASAMPEVPPLRIGLTPVFLHDQTAFINAWRTYLQNRLQRPIEFIQRGSYREITELLHNGQLDFAWLCGYAFLNNQRYSTLLAVPLYRGKPTYRAYLIVPSSDRRTRTLAELRHKVFAFSDPDSNSGYLVPVHELLEIKENPGAFFGKSFFTWSHRKVVEAVAAGVAQGGAVDGYVWDTLALQEPQLTSRTRVAKESIEFGFPPIVASKTAAPADAAAMRNVLLTMAQDPEGVVLLRRLQLDGFVAGEDGLYSDIARMMKSVSDR